MKSLSVGVNKGGSPVAVLANDGQINAPAPFRIVHAAKIGHVFFAPVVDVHVASLALDALVDQTVEQSAAVVAKGGRTISEMALTGYSQMSDSQVSLNWEFAHLGILGIDRFDHDFVN
uniref:Uncharacterized protein n=1 Tax=Romanomermis culicivorax TaxID=13658 RepID=A0A915K8V3_ROMCU